jgi:hypothetical protein
MAEGFQTPDGTPVDLEASDRAFAAAMASEPGEATDLPKRPAPVPEEAGKPKAAKRGRPPKSVRSSESVQAVTPELTAKRAGDVAGTVQAVGGAFLAGAAMTGMDALKADAYSLQGFAEPIGKAAADVAAVDPAFARYIDKSGSGGKVLAYLGLFGTVAGLGAQLAANHGLVKPGTLGAHDPADVIAAYEQSESADADTPQE